VEVLIMLVKKEKIDSHLKVRKSKKQEDHDEVQLQRELHPALPPPQSTPPPAPISQHH
jgi:hypothetical protein